MTFRSMFTFILTNYLLYSASVTCTVFDVKCSGFGFETIVWQDCQICDCNEYFFYFKFVHNMFSADNNWLEL